MSLDRLESHLASLLDDPDLSVVAGVPVTGAGTDQVAGLTVTEVTSRSTMGARRPVQLEPLDLRRIAPVVARVVITVVPGSDPDGRAAALRAVTELWWRCDDVAITSGAAFPDDVAEGYSVEQVVPVSVRTADHEEGEDVHRVELDVIGAVWPRLLAGGTGVPITHALVRLATEPPIEPVTQVSIETGLTIRVPVQIDLRTMVIGSTEDAPPAGSRSFRVGLEPLGDQMAGTLSEEEITVDENGAAAVEYTAGDSPGADRVLVRLVDGEDPGVLAGSFDIQVEAGVQ